MQLIDVKSVTSTIKENLKNEVERLCQKIGKKPGVALMSVGDNFAAQSYTASLKKGCLEIGIEIFEYNFPEQISEKDFLDVIEKLNQNNSIDGIQVQMPIPDHISIKKIIDKISLYKDIDGFKSENIGKLLLGDKEAFSPCTPMAVMSLLEHYNIPIEGKDVVIMGRSNIVGKPMAAHIINANGTPIVCNTFTQNIVTKLKMADIIIMAIGQPKFLKKEMIKENAVVIDIGINRLNGKLCGDADFDDVKDKVSYISPVPGGVGLMTVAMLMKNIIKAFKINKNID